MRSEKERIYAIKTFGKHFVFMKGNDIREEQVKFRKYTRAIAACKRVNFILYLSITFFQLLFFDAHDTRDIHIIIFIYYDYYYISIIYLLYSVIFLLYNNNITLHML